MDPRLQQHPLGYYEIAEKPTPEELKKYYAEKYYQEAKSSYEHEYSQDELRFFQTKLEQRHSVLQQVQGPATGGGRVLDVGCGEGYALAFFQKQGYTVKGLDFSSAGVESKNPGCMDVLVTGDVFDLLQNEIDSGEPYDVVWLQNVLEHVIDPIGLLQSLRKLVSSNGVAVVTIPNDYSLIQQEALSREHIDRPFWVVPPDHLAYFEYDSLINIAEATGWRSADILSDFPIDWYLYHAGSNYVMDKSAGKNAHHARVQLENILAKKPMEDAVNFWRAMAKVGAGRSLTAFLVPEAITE